ncbi:MAG: hypothetical protein V1484_02900 [bacterium]
MGNLGVVASDPRRVERLVSRLSPIVREIIEGKTELWLHDEQRVGRSIKGWDIFNCLTYAGLLSGCVRVHELRDIQSMGVGFFRQYFAGRKVFGWRTPGGDHRVSFICDGRDKVLLGWGSLEDFLFGDSPALRILE